MTTGHVFNAMKMLYNHVAEKAGLRVIWHQHRYPGWAQMAGEAPEWMLKHMVIFIHVIEQRQDLPEKYRKPYMAIIFSILDALNIPYGDTMLPDMWKQLPERATCE